MNKNPNTEHRKLKSGLVQFRADQELLEQIRQLADHNGIPISVLVRSWVSEKVRQLLPSIPLKELSLAGVGCLNQDSPYARLEELHRTYQAGKLELSRREAQTLISWLPAHRNGEPYLAGR